MNLYGWVGTMGAKELKNLFEAVANRRWDAAVGAAQPIAPMPATGLLAPLPVDVALADVELSKASRTTLVGLIEEHRRVGDLRRHGLEPRRRVLLHGPPGCGKSMTARALAHELALPAFLVRYDALIGAWLGQTAQRVQDVFRFAREVPAVIVVDEVDALTRARGRSNDVGEMDRVLIAFLQNLEHEPLAGLLVATTNVAGHLDAALWRRFDVVLELPRPSEK